MAKHNVISFEHSSGAVKKRLFSEKRRRAIAGMRELLRQTLPHLMQDLFDRLDDEFYELADKSANDLLQTRYFEAMRELRKLRHSMEKAFLSERLLDFDRFWEEAPPPSATSADERLDIGEEEMSLIEEDDLEERLAVMTLVSKAKSRYHRTLFALNERFAALHGVESFDQSHNPVGPERLVAGFAEALKQWQGETEVRLIVYKLFDRHVMAYVGGLYDEFNDLLVANDVLPKISQKMRRNPVSPSVRGARDTGEGEAGTTPGEWPLDPSLLSALNRMVAARRGDDPRLEAAAWYARAEVEPNLLRVDSDELLHALGEVQRYSMNTAPADVAGLRELQAELMRSLGRELEVGSPERPMKRLDDGDRGMLDVMELLFDFILGDENLPEPMKALLGRLQIPMLKVGLMDRCFFSDSSHPARRLLNNLARAGLAWNDDGDRSANSPYGRIESAVTRVLSEFDDDVAVFDRVNEQFESWLAREQRSAQVAEKRLTQAREGQEHLDQARRCVSEELDSLFAEYEPGARRLPRPVVELIDSGWRDVMLLALLREGKESKAWDNARRLARELVWSVQPKRNPVERQRLLKAIPNLLTGLREGLNNISFDQHRAAALLKELQVCHIAALRGNRPKEVPLAEPPKNAVAIARNEELILDRDASTDAAPADEWQRMAEELEPGSWLEWRDEEGHEVRGKLSWRSQVTGNCVFVDRRGMKMAELTTTELAALLRSGRGRPLEDLETPLMDRALNTMLEVLKRTEPDDRPD